MGKTKIKTIDDSIKTDDRRSKVEDSNLNPIRSDLKMEDGKIDNPSSTINPQKSTIKHSHGAKYQKSRGQVDPLKKYPLKEAVELTQKTSYTKFPGTIEAHLNTTAKNLRGLVNLPYFAGKKLTILAFGPASEEAGADIVGSEEAIEEISRGKINFDVLVTTPEWMPKLAKVAKILGPKGLMPSPKTGTVTDNLSKTIADLKAGKTEFKTEKDGTSIHLAVGKTTQDPEEIAENIKTLFNTIGKSKISKITLSSTMGPGVKVELSSI